jgi:hypothetical protein
MSSGSTYVIFRSSRFDIACKFTKTLLKIFVYVFVKEEINFKIYLGSNSCGSPCLFFPWTIKAILLMGCEGPSTARIYYKSVQAAYTSQALEWLGGESPSAARAGPGFDPPWTLIFGIILLFGRLTRSVRAGPTGRWAFGGTHLQVDGGGTCWQVAWRDPYVRLVGRVDPYVISVEVDPHVNWLGR